MKQVSKELLVIILTSIFIGIALEFLLFVMFVRG